MMKFLIFAFAVLTLLFQSCSPFKELSKTISQRTEISDIYSNECDSIVGKNSPKQQLWQTIDKEYIPEKTGLFVKIRVTKKNKIVAQLLDGDSLIRENIIKGHFKDNCYYKRRFFYVVPILPVLWWFENRQTRIFRDQNFLVLEEKVTVQLKIKEINIGWLK